jgi:methylated-DNA-protein-cysteine methyltransferase related protein
MAFLVAGRAPDQILAAVRAIPAGFVRTYGDLSPGAPRAAGRALHDCAEHVPWWRVVRADGSLPLGEAQRARLDAEGVPLLATKTPRVDMRKARLAGPAAEQCPPESLGRQAVRASRRQRAGGFP